MIQKALLILLIVLLVWIGIKLIVRVLPDLFGGSGSNPLSGGSSGSRPVIYGRTVKEAGILFGIFNVLPSLLPAVARREQVNILKKEIEQLKVKRKLISSSLKYLLPLEKDFDEKVTTLLENVEAREFNFVQFRVEIQSIKRLAKQYIDRYIETDEMFAGCIELLIRAGEKAKSDADLAALAKIEDDFNRYKLSKFEFGDLDSLNKLYDELRKEHKKLSNWLNFGSASVDATQSSSRNYYEILEVDPAATADEIKTAYRKKSKEYHPDVKTAEMNKVADEDVRKEIEKAFERKFREVNEAYEVLSDLQKRKDYDATF